MAVFIAIPLIALLLYRMYLNAKNNKLIALRPVLAQQALDTHNKVEKAFIMNYMPFIDYLKGLDLYYKKGGKKLTKSELNYYLSYPKHIYLDENEDVICNGVNIGSAKEKEYQYTDKISTKYDYSKIECPIFHKDHLILSANNYDTKFNCFKGKCSGNIIIDEYKYSHDYTSNYTIHDEIMEDRKLELSTIAAKKVNENQLNSIKDFEKTYKENIDLIDKYFPEELKKIYSDFNKNIDAYKKDDIDRILVDYYARSNIEYMKENKPKLINEEKRKYATILNNYESKGWGNAVDKLYDRKGSGEWNRYSYTLHSGYFFKNDIEKYEDGFGDKIIKKYDLKVNY